MKRNITIILMIIIVSLNFTGCGISNKTPKSTIITIDDANRLLQEAFNSGINSYAFQEAQISDTIYTKKIYESLKEKKYTSDNTQPTIDDANRLLQEAFNSGINSYALQEAQVAETIYNKYIYESLRKDAISTTQPTTDDADRLLKEAFNSGINSYALQEAQVANDIYTKKYMNL